jgi:putative oxidoreductase
LVSGDDIAALPGMTPKSRAARICIEVALWLLCLRLTVLFFGAGWDKFDPESGWARAFTAWGYPTWFRIVVGAMEIVAALLLLVPSTAAYGAAIILLVMFGGMGTHVFIEHRASRVTSELLHLVVALIVVAGRWQVRIKHLKG